MQKISTILMVRWTSRREAMNFYASIFKNSKVGNVSRYGEAGPEAERVRDDCIV